MSPLLRKLLLATTLFAAGTAAFASQEQTATTSKSAPATADLTAKAAPVAGANTATSPQKDGATAAATTAKSEAQPATPAAQGYRIAAPEDETDPAPLEAMLLLSTQYAVQDMYFLSPPQFPPSLNTKSIIYEGQILMAVPVVRRYAISDEGTVDVRYQMSTILPDGQIEEDVGEVPLYVGKAPAEASLLFPAEGLSGFYTGKDQGPGKYTMRALVTDNTSGKSQMLEQEITVLAYKVPALPDDFDSDKWMMQYYTAPQPEFALPALSALMQNVESERIEKITAPMLGFYNRVLTDNPWLLPFFSKRLEESLDKVNQGGRPESADIMLGLILSFHLRDAQERPESISERIWAETESNRQFDWSYVDPGTAEFIYYPQQLDYLWGQFFASGSYSPIYSLIKVLFQNKEAAAAAAPQSILDLSEEHRKALAEAVLGATQWSLTSNARQQRLVLAYLFGTALRPNDELSEDQRKQLQGMVMAIIKIMREAHEKAEAERAPESAQESSEATAP